MTVLGLLHALNPGDEFDKQRCLQEFGGPLKSCLIGPHHHKPCEPFAKPKLMTAIKAFRAQDNIHQPVYLSFSVLYYVSSYHTLETRLV